jgi:hypothetical protein
MSLMLVQKLVVSLKHTNSSMVFDCSRSVNTTNAVSQSTISQSLAPRDMPYRCKCSVQSALNNFADNAYKRYWLTDYEKDKLKLLAKATNSGTCAPECNALSVVGVIWFKQEVVSGATLSPELYNFEHTLVLRRNWPGNTAAGESAGLDTRLWDSDVEDASMSEEAYISLLRTELVGHRLRHEENN